MTKIILTSLFLLFNALSFGQLVSTDANSDKTIDVSDPIAFIGESQDGNWLVIGTLKGAYLYSTLKGKITQKLKHNVNKAEAVYYAHFNENATEVCTVDRNGRKLMWDVNTGDEIKGNSASRWTIEPHNIKKMGLKSGNPEIGPYNQQTNANHNTKEGIYASSKPGIIRFYNDEDKVLQKLFFDGKINDVYTAPCIFSNNGKWFIVGTGENGVLFYKVL